jgi:cytochrome c551/c552
MMKTAVFLSLVLVALAPFALANEQLAREKNCLACHGIDNKLVGPALREVSAKYSGERNAEVHLVSKILRGGSGVWGAIPMPANPHVTEREARQLVQWILSPGLSGSATIARRDGPPLPQPRTSSMPEHDSLRNREDWRLREQARSQPRVNLQVSVTEPTPDGDVIISIQTNTDTASLKINGEEQGGRADGRYRVKKIARAGQETLFNIVATDINGNTDNKTVAVSRPIVESKASFAALNPGQIKRQAERDAVAIIIGITDYKHLPKAEFASDDARVFYDYAIRGLGIKPDNIKLLLDDHADEVEIIKSFKTWLPSRVRSSTDVYVFYSGHGLPTPDGQGLYLLPQRADRDFISRTSIQFQEINADIQATRPKSVTLFVDACYSGQARSGEALIASARPVVLKTDKKLFPDHFAVMTASQADQISSASPDLKHGIFSYYLMKGMEGDADANNDGKITLGEMQSYLVENVKRQAGMMSRKQEPQLIGDVNQVLVGR